MLRRLCALKKLISIVAFLRFSEEHSAAIIDLEPTETRLSWPAGSRCQVAFL